MPLHILHILPGFGYGGQQRRVTDLCNYMGDVWRHSIIALNQDESAGARFHDKAPVDFIRLDHFSAKPWQAIATALHHIKEIKPDIICTYNWGAIEWAIAGRMQKIKGFHFEDGFGPEGAPSAWSRKSLIRRLAIGGSLKMIVISRHLENIAKKIWHIRPDNFLYIQNGINMQDVIAKTPHIHNQIIQIGWLGGLRPEKRVDRLIQAAAPILRTGKAHLTLMGAGNCEAELQLLLQNLNLANHVTFTGHVDDIYGHLAALDIFALSSDTEQSPYVIAEAMATGLPCVTTNVGDCLLMLGEHQKDYVTKLSVEDFQKALESLVYSADERHRIGALNQQRAQNLFSMDRMLEKYRDLLRE